MGNSTDGFFLFGVGKTNGHCNSRCTAWSISLAILDFITLSEEVDLMELSVTQKIAEKTVQEINPRKMFGINLIAVKHNGSLEIEMKPDTILHRGDTVCIIGTRENIRKFERFLNE